MLLVGLDPYCDCLGCDWMSKQHFLSKRQLTTKHYITLLTLHTALYRHAGIINILIFPIPNLQNHRIFFLGNYSCLAAKFNLHRSIGFHLVQSYIPTILFVIVSWVSFWMDVEHVPGRVALGVTTLLTISSKSAGLSSESPQVSYVKVK